MKIDYNKHILNQKDALVSTELLDVFSRCRLEKQENRFAPKYHFYPPIGGLNDPNGLCFFKGKWHLFYQHEYTTKCAVNIHRGSVGCWGHAYSEDLINWKDLPDALFPYEDEPCCWSGNVLIEDDRAIAANYGKDAGVFIWISTDDLLVNWEKISNDPVIPIIGENDPLYLNSSVFYDKKYTYEEILHNVNSPYPVYDPFVFKQGDQYYLLIGAAEYLEEEKKLHRQEYLFKSNDLVNWYYIHPFIDKDVFGKFGDDGACPYLVDIGDKNDDKKLFVHFSHMSGSHYMVGKVDYENEKFIPLNGDKFTSGGYEFGGLHAPSCFADGKNANIIFNMNNCSCEAFPIMSLPYSLSLSENRENEIEFAAIASVKSLRKNEVSYICKTVKRNQNISFDNVFGDCLELELQLDIPVNKVFNIYFLKSSDNNEYLKLSIFRNTGIKNRDLFVDYAFVNSGNTVAFLDSSHSSIDSDTPIRASEIAVYPVRTDEIITVSAFVDKSVIEIILNGRKVIAQRVYPSKDDSIGISFEALGGDTEILSLKKWDMESIY